MAANEGFDSEVASQDAPVSTPPMGFKVIVREILRDKVALVALILLAIIVVGVFVGAQVLDQDRILRISLMDQYTPPNSEFWLGTDSGGRDIFGLLVIGARNSILIGTAVTAITSLVGVMVGIIAGYYGGVVDNILMRIVDFIMLLPTTMLIIVFVTIVSDYDVWTFIFIMSAFYWTGQARLIRSKALSEGRRDYVSASKTMATPSFMIMFREIMPNISSLIIVNLTLNFAANIGIETGLTFLGFGLPTSTPSLGTLVSYASSPDILENKTWVWLPASLLILVLMLCINYVGQALKRAADAKQRLG